MPKLHFTFQVNAPRQKVWETMLGTATYPVWAKEFSPDNEESIFEGNWDQGTRVRFMGQDKAGKLSGIAGMITVNRPNEFIEIEYDSEIVDGKDIPSPAWKGTHESYAFADKDGGTELTINVDVTPEFQDYMAAAWPKALNKLKELAEK